MYSFYIFSDQMGELQSQNVTTAFEQYKTTLGEVDRTYKKSIEDETETLQRLDDILSELAMVRRVQEDTRLVCLDYFRGDKSATVEAWAKRGRSKLKRLEEDAVRVRRSVSNSHIGPKYHSPHFQQSRKGRFKVLMGYLSQLVTLLSLKQREVNAESLINSELQSQILFVFTAAIVLFVIAHTKQISTVMEKKANLCVRHLYLGFLA